MLARKIDEYVEKSLPFKETVDERFLLVAFILSE